MFFDILSPSTAIAKTRKFSQSLFDGAIKAGLDAKIMPNYRPRPGAILVVYGAGGADRFPHVQAHPGTVVCWDIGYWERDLPYAERKYRVSIGALHPKQVMQGPYPGPDRWLSANLRITQARCRGPIMLVGNGPKSNVIGAANWAAKKAREIRTRLPGQPIAYRPKPRRPHDDGVNFDLLSSGEIEEALAATSLVVCRHSNVAVDACRMGVPVVCDDGAAAAIYPQRLEDVANQPSAEVRKKFLHRLAWWQWSIAEIESGQAWQWLFERLRDDRD